MSTAEISVGATRMFPGEIMYPRKETDRWHVDLALLGLYKERMLQKAEQCYLDMLHIVLRQLGEDQNLIDIHANKVISHISQQVVQKALEDSWSITKWNHQVLIPFPDAD